MITKMTILQQSALSADNSRYQTFDRIAIEAKRAADMYQKACRLFEYLSKNDGANVREAFIMFFGTEPTVKTKTKKERSYSVGMVYVHEIDE